MFIVLPLTSDGEGHVVFNLGGVQVEAVTRFNYTVSSWHLDLIDAAGDLMIAGINMVPNVDLLKPYAQIKAKMGSLVVVELNDGDYMNPDLLGSNVQLLWYPVGTPVVLP